MGNLATLLMEQGAWGEACAGENGAMDKIKRTTIRLYILAGLLTFAFQVGVRTAACEAQSNCILSFSKGAVWSVVWPASWYVFLRGVD